MSEKIGYDFILKVNTGTVGVPVWTEIASGRGLSFNPNTDVIDVSSKAGRNRQFLSGMNSETISCEAMFIRSGSDFTTLQTAQRAGSRIQVMRAESAVHQDGSPANVEWAYAYITSMPQDFPYDGPATISIELQITSDDGSDPWTAV